MSQQASLDPTRLAQQVLAATSSMSDEEAGQRYRQILAQLPRAEATQLNALALAQVAPDQRRVLASGLKSAHQDPSRPFDGYDEDDDETAATPQSLGRMSAQAAQQDPALLGNLLGGENSGLGGQIGKAALAALAAILIRKYLMGDSQQAGGASGPVAGVGADPVAMILGSILGGATGAPQQQQQGGAGGLGAILGSVLGQLGGQAGQPQQQGGAPDLGSILGSVLGQMGGGGGQAQQQPQQGGAGDLGSILGSVLGQMNQPQQGQQGGAPDLGSILGSILGGAGSRPSYKKD